MPRLRWAQLGLTEPQLLPAIGQRLNFVAPPDGVRRCLGHTARDGERRTIDCAAPPVEGRQCERCRTIDNVAASQMHQAHRLGRGAVDGRIARHLEQPHRLYVAAFRDGSLKVGTTAGAAGGHRLLEQGAWRACYVASVKDGFAVRDLEDLVTEELGLQQAVTVARKIAGHERPLEEPALTTLVKERTAEVHALMARVDDAAWDAISDPWQHPSVGDPRWSGVQRYPARPQSGTHDLRIEDLVGRVALMSSPGFDERFLVDLGTLDGVELDIGDHEADPLAVQASLF